MSVEAAVEALVQRFGGARASQVADAWPDAERLVAVQGLPDVARALRDAAREDGVPDGELLAMLRGAALGYTAGRGAVQVDTVWTGPGTHEVPVRSTMSVLHDVLGAARASVILTSYSAAGYGPLRDDLADAVARGAVVDVVVETLSGAGSALSGVEPARAFAGIDGLRLWHWPAAVRPTKEAKMHAKVVVADAEVLFATSANLTPSGASRNLEAGVLVRGGSAPRRASEHLRALMAAGALVRLEGGG